MGLYSGTVPSYSILFHTVSGTIRNLDINGARYTAPTTTVYASLFVYILDNGIMENCKAYGHIDSNKGTGVLSFGIFVYIMSGISTVDGCINDMDIDVTEFSSGTTYASGILNSMTSGVYCKIINCINNGDIISTVRTAGIVSIVTNSTLLLDNNLNTGTIKSTDTTSSDHASAGGILAMLASGTVTLKNNTNLGDIENINPNATAGAGGIIGSMYFTSGTRTATLHNNLNTATITSTARERDYRFTNFITIPSGIFCQLQQIRILGK